MELELGWRNDVLEVEYNSSTKESYSTLFTQVGDIRPSFPPSPNEVNLLPPGEGVQGYDLP